MSYKIHFILPLLLALFQSVGMQATPDERLDVGESFEKSFSEVYDVNGQGSVRLENRYGEINVETWERNQVKIDVLIKVTADNREQANQTFQRITIDFTGGSNRATATTTIGSQNSSAGFFDRLRDWAGSSSSSNDFKIYYKVKMPASATLETVAKYCSVRLPNLSGNNTTSVAYGDVVAGKLSGSNTVAISYGSIRADQLGKISSLRLRYSEGKIENADVLTYDGRYGGLKIDQVNRIKIDAGYDDIEIERADDVTIRGNYNDIKVGTAEILDLEGNYSDFSFTRINKSIKASSNYGDVEVEEIGPDFEKIDISTRYADVELGMPDGRGYNLDVKTHYGDISCRSKGELNRNTHGSSERINGTVNGRGNGSVRIDTSYGDIVMR